jgi:subtilisin-like proprotein convertase family protein
MPSCADPTRALVQVFISIPHRGDLRIDLLGPTGAVYRLKDSDPLDTAPDVNQVFPLKLLGVSTAAPTSWTLRVTDESLGINSGILIGWAMSM